MGGGRKGSLQKDNMQTLVDLDNMFAQLETSLQTQKQKQAHQHYKTMDQRRDAGMLADQGLSAHGTGKQSRLAHRAPCISRT